jgi:hypothetical protein
MISSDNELKKYLLSDDEWIKIQEIIGLMEVLYLSI